ncbi:MAG TPA: CRTAC1 family protein [Gemmatimonadales bacterium]|nr:CRTAC1 family protein [Gemmatimonadales bacterium]
MSRSRSLLLLTASAFLGACADASKAPGPAASPAAVPASLLARQAEQRAAAAGSPAYHDFSLTDRVDSSGITFENLIVDDAGKTYKKVHYDHGTGLASADVDGDGRPDLYFVSQLGTSGLWRNLGGGKFEDITASSGLGMPDIIAVSASFADIDNDGDPDLFVSTVRHGNRLFENQGGKFRDITGPAGVGYVGHSSGAVFFDYDGDGRLDLFVANVGVYTSDERGAGGFYLGLTDAFHGHTHPDRTEASILYRNQGGNSFRDVSKETGLVDTGWSGDATILDANGDGRPDLYVLNMQGENHLWVNEGGKRFRDATKGSFPKTPWGAMGVKAFDWNGDGRIDLYVTDMHSDMFTLIPPDSAAAEDRKSNSAAMGDDLFPTGKQPFIFGNALYTNRGAGRFEEQSDSAGVENYWPWGPSVDDLNADGWDDIFIASSMNFPHRYGINSVLLNEAGRHFLRSEFLLGVEPRAGGATEKVWFTLDCAGADSGNKFCQGCSGAGAVQPECTHHDAQGRLVMMGSLGTRSALMTDLDGDGDLDIVTNEFNARPQILISNLSARHPVHWLGVRLTGKRSNREGIGAAVTVLLPGSRSLVKWMDGKSGYLSQSDLPLYFGLGDATQAAGIEVRWPSGARQQVPGPVTAGRVIEIAEP